MAKSDDIKYAELFCKWYSWGSPVGLGLLVLALSASFAVLAVAIKHVFFM